MIPLYGFFKGDTIGLLVLGYEDETIADLAKKLQIAARVRVAKKKSLKLIYKGRTLDQNLKLSHSGIEPLERFDVLEEEEGV